MACFQQEFILAPTFGFGFFVKLGHFDIHFLAFAKEEQVDEISDRFRVAGARASSRNDRPQVFAVFAAERNFRHIQHIEDSGVAHLILQGKKNEIELGDRVQRFQAVESDVVLTHFLLHVSVRCEYTLAPPVFAAVIERIENFHAKMGHTHLIFIREAEGQTNIYLFPVFDDAVQLAANVLGRLLYVKQDLFQFFRDHCDSSMFFLILLF